MNDYNEGEEMELTALDAEIGEDEGHECLNCGQDIHNHNNNACQGEC